MRTPAEILGTPVSIAVPGSDLCLDFANTRYWRGSPTPTEQLARPSDLLAWCGSAGGLPAFVAAAIARIWQTSPRREAAMFARAMASREAIYRLFAAQPAGNLPDAADLEAINIALAQAPQRIRLVPADDGFAWHLPNFEAHAAYLLAPVLWSAGDLLTTPRRQRVRCCANEKCRWVFVDDSRAGTRRWCQMSACGNRAKAHRHYERHKKS